VTLLYRRALFPQLNLWIFASQYDFPELETHCLAADHVKREVLSTLRNPQLGVGYFINAGLHLTSIDKLIAAILSRGTWKETLRQVHQEEEKKEKEERQKEEERQNEWELDSDM
jgi:hypothetical protein